MTSETFDSNPSTPLGMLICDREMLHNMRSYEGPIRREFEREITRCWGRSSPPTRTTSGVTAGTYLHSMDQFAWWAWCRKMDLLGEKLMTDDITAVCASAATRCRDFSPKAREFVPLAATLADGSMLMCASRGEKIDAKALNKQVTADVRSAAKVTFWANPLLWLELGRMVWRVIQYLMSRRGA